AALRAARAARRTRHRARAHLRLLDTDGRHRGVSDGAELSFRDERILVRGLFPRRSGVPAARRPAGARDRRIATAVQRFPVVDFSGVRLEPDLSLMDASIDVVRAAT